ncbi:hypothetical protein TgHK011_006418 [Trichoderma gracile]|nr:hypothetical protein TgHK011_006418 [Trichoderma gracile]
MQASNANLLFRASRPVYAYEQTPRKEQDGVIHEHRPRQLNRPSLHLSLCYLVLPPQVLTHCAHPASRYEYLCAAQQPSSPVCDAQCAPSARRTVHREAACCSAPDPTRTCEYLSPTRVFVATQRAYLKSHSQNAQGRSRKAWCQGWWQEAHQEGPQRSQARSLCLHVGKLLGERWKALNDKQRAPYEAKAAADKKRYEDEKQAYNADQEEDSS